MTAEPATPTARPTATPDPGDRTARRTSPPRGSQTEAPETTAMRAGRGRNGGALAPILWADVRVQVAPRRRRPPHGDDVRGPPPSTPATATRPCAAFEDAVAELGGRRGGACAFASGMGAISAVVLGLCSAGRPHRGPAPDLRRDPAAAAGGLPPLRHRRHARRRHRPRRLRRGGAARADGAGAGRDAGQPLPRPRRPRRARRPSPARSPSSTRPSPPRSASARSTTASTWSCTRRPRRIAGHNDATPRRGRRRPRAHRLALGLRRAAGRQRLALRRPERPARPAHARRCACASRPRPPGGWPRCSRRHPAVALGPLPGPRLAPPARPGQAPAAAHSAASSPSTSPGASRRPRRSSRRSTCAGWRRRWAGPRRWSPIPPPARTPA